MGKIEVKYIPSEYIADFSWFGTKMKRVFRWIRS
jgi:hypothetical protein